MLTSLSFQAPCIEMNKLNNLWFHLTGFTCNLKCRHCYSSCGPTNKSRKFLNLEKIKQTLNDTNKEHLEEIYLFGGEPLLHRDINNIIRLCIKRSNVNILTNATLINDKKARFLRRIELDSDYEIIFRVGLDHYKEHKNDELRGKGSFRKALNGISNLVNSDFNPIITAVNLWGEEEAEFKAGFLELLAQFDFEVSEINLKIIPAIKTGEYAKNFTSYSENELVTNESFRQSNPERFDCVNSRVITENGVYVCPTLVNDPRGKIGETLTDSAQKFFLELSTCYSCQSANKKMFNNDWNQ